MSSELLESPAFAAAMAGEQRSVLRATPADAFARAREIFLSGQKLDMVALAASVGVARGTLYRWTGDRDRLLGDVAWAETSDLLGWIDRSTRGRGVTALARRMETYLTVMSDNAPLRAFLAHEGEAGLRLLTDPRGGLRPRLVAYTETVIEAEVARGAYRAPDEPGVIADGIVSLGERFLYNGGDAALNPNPVLAVRVIRLLLREDPADNERPGVRDAAGADPAAHLPSTRPAPRRRR